MKSEMERSVDYLEDMYEDVSVRLEVISDIIDELVEAYPEQRVKGNLERRIEQKVNVEKISGVKMKYEIEIYGYGGEIVMGKLTKEQYEFWIDSADRESEELHSHLFWDPWSDEDGNPMTDDEDPRWLGQWYEIDDRHMDVMH